MLALSYDRILFSYWDGSTDLKVEFLVTDASSGHPIPAALIEVQQEQIDGKEIPEQYILAADASGSARTMRHGIFCCGAQSGLRLTNSYSVLPECAPAAASAFSASLIRRSSAACSTGSVMGTSSHLLSIGR
jgi:hypothetical protein